MHCSIYKILLSSDVDPDPHSFGSVDQDPEVLNEGKSRVIPTKFYFLTVGNYIFEVLD